MNNSTVLKATVGLTLGWGVLYGGAIARSYLTDKPFERVNNGALLVAHDANKDNNLSPDEAINLVMQYDSDKDGYLSLEERKSVQKEVDYFGNDLHKNVREAKHNITSAAASKSDATKKLLGALLKPVGDAVIKEVAEVVTEQVTSRLMFGATLDELKEALQKEDQDQ